MLVPWRVNEKSRRFIGLAHPNLMKKNLGSMTFGLFSPGDVVGDMCVFVGDSRVFSNAFEV